MKENDTQPIIDAVDRRLLAALQRDASLTNQALAASAHVSAATCMRRVRRLVATGVIERQVALVNPNRIGGVLEVFSEITLDRQGVEHLEAFESRAVAHPAVRQCYRVSPGPDFIVLATVCDMPAWAEVVNELLTQDANVRNVKTFFCVKRAKFETAFSLPAAPA